MNIRKLFYDFEVFKHDWCVVIKDADTGETWKIVNDVIALRELYTSAMDCIWIGYNSRRYDQYILKSILIGLNPKDVSDRMIVNEEPGWSISPLFRGYKLYNYDCMTSMNGLKQLESFMGNDIRETTVPFDIERKLTNDEMLEVLFYCEHDVNQTIEVFKNTISEFDSHISLIETFNLPRENVSKTQAQLSAIILDASKLNFRDEFKFTFVDTLRLKKYKYIMDKYASVSDEIKSDKELYRELISDKVKKRKWYKDKSFVEVVNGLETSFGFGGVHGAVKKVVEDGFIVNSDVESYYPSLSIRYKFLSRTVRNYAKFKSIYETNLKLKHEGRKREREPFKRICNICYGATKDEFNNLYDPRQANNICINGQLLLLDLVERVEESLPSAVILQLNTDGVMFKLESESDFTLYKEICMEWQVRSGMILEHDLIKKLIQKDVNNYIVIMDNGKVKSKGSYVKQLSKLDNDLPIVNRALIDYFTKNISIEQTINSCDDLIMFQKVVKVTSKYRYALHGDKILKEKVLRVFASNDNIDGGIFKMKHGKNNGDKVGNTPLRAFIDNSNVNGKKTPDKLDKQYYIQLANKRLIDFVGVKNL